MRPLPGEEWTQYGTCSKHGRVEAAWVDDGIGWYEYWGHMAYDSRPVAVCPECEEPLDDVG